MLHIRSFHRCHFELIVDGGRLPAHSHGYGHGVAVVKAALDVGEGLEPHELLSRVSKPLP